MNYKEKAIQKQSFFSFISMNIYYVQSSMGVRYLKPEEILKLEELLKLAEKEAELYEKFHPGRIEKYKARVAAWISLADLPSPEVWGIPTSYGWLDEESLNKLLDSLGRCHSVFSTWAEPNGVEVCAFWTVCDPLKE